MTNANFTISQEVIRIKGDYVVGRKGLIVAIDSEKNRAQVQWYGNTKTWVSFNAIGLTTDWTVENYKAYPKAKSDVPATHKVMYNGKEYDAINFGTL